MPLYEVEVRCNTGTCGQVNGDSWYKTHRREPYLTKPSRVLYTAAGGRRGRVGRVTTLVVQSSRARGRGGFASV